MTAATVICNRVGAAQIVRGTLASVTCWIVWCLGILSLHCYTMDDIRHPSMDSVHGIETHQHRDQYAMGLSEREGQTT